MGGLYRQEREVRDLRAVMDDRKAYDPRARLCDHCERVFVLDVRTYLLWRERPTEAVLDEIA